MRWRRKILSALAVLLLAAGLISGARLFGGGTDGGEASGSGSGEEGSGGIVRLRVTYPYMEGISDISELEEVQEAVNEIAREKIGAEIELVPVDAGERKTEYSLWLSRGDAVDLMLVEGTDLDFYIGKGFLNFFNGYLERGADMLWYLDEARGRDLTEGTSWQGRIYGVANLSRQSARGYGLWVSRQALETAGISFDEERVYSMGEVGVILERLKQVYPDSYPLGQITGGQSDSTVFQYMDAGDALGSSGYTGVVRRENDQVVNLYATEEYRSFLAYMTDWYARELIYPDGLIYDGAVTELLRDQTVLMIPASSYPGTMDLLMGEETDFVCLRTTEVRPDNSREYWTVPTASKYPRAAVEFLELMYRDQRIAWLLNRGISGEHYRTADDAYRLAEPLGSGSGTGGFYNPFFNLGNAEDLYDFGTPGQQLARGKYNEEGIRMEGGRYEGFVYHSPGVARQTDAAEKVLETYLPVLESGEGDLEEDYAAFLGALEEAGIGDILADKQRQLDEWMAERGMTSDL